MYWRFNQNPAANTISAFRHFQGNSRTRRVELLYCDNAPELTSVGRELRYNVEYSQPGVPQTNGLAERNNQDILSGTRTMLAAAGLPACFWPWAAPCYCMRRNSLVNSQTGESPWSKTHGGEDLSRKLIPFGCGVWFKPAPTKYVPSKWEPRGQWGIFAGYRLAPGCEWRGDYFVWDLDQFMGVDFSVDSSGRSQPNICEAPMAHIAETAQIIQIIQIPLTNNSATPNK